MTTSKICITTDQKIMKKTVIRVRPSIMTNIGFFTITQNKCVQIYTT